MQYRVFVFILFLALSSGTTYGRQACAQISTPEIQVDLSVLETLGRPADNGGTPSSQTLRRNTAPDYKPLLTNGPAVPAPPQMEQMGMEMTPPAVVSKPPPPATAVPAPEKRQTSLRPGTVVPPLPPAKPHPYKEANKNIDNKKEKLAPAVTAAPPPHTDPAMPEKNRTAEKAKIVSFPVKTSSRSETSDPSLPVSPPSIKSAAKETESLPQKVKTVLPFIPMPGDLPEAVPVMASEEPRAPLPEQKPENTKVSSVKMPPIPPRRPAKQKASESFVAEARAKNIPREIKPADASGFPMPAIPALPVKMENLPEKKTAVTDKLEAQLLRADRDAILKTVENIADQRENKAVKSENFPAAVAANDLKKTMSEPYIRKKSMPDITVEPAAGGGEIAKTDIKAKDITAKMVPRPPPQEKHEEDYISMPFQAGKDALDDGTLALMQESILKQLQNNPSWRVQIQAFASPTDEGSSSARRLSLARALAVRTWLMDKGIEAGRMDVRALGMQTDRNPADRVDLIIFDPKNG